MPVTPDATESLSGGSGISAADLVKRILRDRLDDNPYTERLVASLDGAGTTDDATVAPGALKRFQPGMWWDFVADGTFETVIVEQVINDTTVRVRRAHRDSTIAAHSADAVFRVQGRVNPLTVSNKITETLDNLWPDIFDVRHVTWTVPDPVDYWYSLPADVEKLSAMYQRTTGTTTHLDEPRSWGGPYFLDSSFIGATKKGVNVFGVTSNAPDDKLHAIYQAKVTLAGLATPQIDVVTYEVAMALMTSEFASESKPERRSGLEGAPDAANAFRLFAVQAEATRKREAKRLAEYLPRKDHRTYRGLRHFYDGSGYYPYHPVRD